MKSKITFLIVVLIALINCSMPMENYKSHTLNEVGRYNHENRIDILSKIDHLASWLYSSKRLSVTKTTHLKSEGAFNKVLPYLSLYDRDGDNIPDQFMYSDKPMDTETSDHGFIFDLNNDGDIDYLVFNGGVVPVKPEDKLFEFRWHNYHAIDSNYDGIFDIIVFNNYVDINKDEYVDKNTTAWIYDNDYDGTPDKAEYIINDRIKPIHPIGGSFTVELFHGETKVSSRDLDKEMLYNKIVNDVNSLIKPY